ncbi:MAG TPA: SRPBCC family protein [Thermoleophilaceae bacterium]|jgi:hypothetical protein|nr:SRPBCC family protein [Thermoleophilaceae bacterium]
MPSHSLLIEADPAVCFDEITDYETFPEWQSAVKEVDVLSVYDDGLGRDVRFAIDAKLRQVAYTLRYSYERPHRVSWDYLEGDGSTLATYSLDIDPQVMKRSVEDLKRRVESHS